MEMFELKYFLAVAADENIHRASEKLSISPASLSKAITRLEDELSVKLFSREGRNIRLTEHGEHLQIRASEIIQLEEQTTFELSGFKGTIQVAMAGPEILLSQMGLEISLEILKKFPMAKFDFKATDDQTAQELVLTGQAHFAMISDDPDNTADFAIKILKKTNFETLAGPGHPLYKDAKAKRPVPVEEILKHAFVSPSYGLLGKVGARQSLDGWRDDKFQRKIMYQTSSLKMIEELVTQGQALAYLPDYFAKKMKVESLNVSGCPYSCQQKIKLVMKKTRSHGWLNQIF